jgi:hypothetical protein
MVPGSKHANPAEIFSHTSIITFNYDRCIEEFLAHALVMYFSISISEAYKIVSRIKIFHAYGAVGSLKGRVGEKIVPCGSAPPVRFGQEVSWELLRDVGPHITTFTEESRSTEEVERMRDLVLDAETIVFLGFGFNDNNLALIRPDNGRVLGAKRIFATACHAPEQERAEIHNKLSLWSGFPEKKRLMIKVGDWTARQFFKEFPTALSAATV